MDGHDGLEEDGIDSNEYYRIITERVINTLKKNNNYMQKEPVSEDLSKAAIDAADNDMQGRQIMEASHDDRMLYSRIFRRGFKAGANWQKAKDQSAIELAEDHAMLAGMEKMKEKMAKDAFEFTKEHNTACVLASECLRNNGWFSRERDFNDLFRHLSCVDELFEGKFNGKTKVIVIKEE